MNKSHVYNVILDLIVIFFLLFTWSCVSVKKDIVKEKEFVSREEFDYIDRDNENIYAYRIYKIIEEEEVIIDDNYINNYMKDVGNRIINSPVFYPLAKDINWTFHIIDSTEVNAFITLEGHVYLYRGLIEKTDSESELASILAFEIGHVIARNVPQGLYDRVMRQPGFIPGDIIKGEIGWERLNRVFEKNGGVLDFFSDLNYSPYQVEKAEEIAFSILSENNFNSRDYFAFINRLANEVGTSVPWLKRNSWNKARRDRIIDHTRSARSFPFKEESQRFNYFINRIQSLSSLEIEEEMFKPFESTKESAFKIKVLGFADWTDTGLEVRKGQEVYIKASGVISLQEGNPAAYCRTPNGLNQNTIQQPIPSENMGALIGKVVQLVSVEKDEETGEEIRNEKVEIFHIGEENLVKIPLDGRLYLGINEDVVGDNSGEYRVEIYF